MPNTAYITRHEKYLRDLLETTPIPAPAIRDAMLYALFPGGKRVRPLLVYLSGELLDVPLATLDVIAVAIELVHAYSLVHDDLPAMDDDDMRRGKPSCHRAFDEATAILVGDGLQALAIDLLLSQLPQTLPLPNVLDVTHELVKACGPAGMVSGQSLDLSELARPDITEAALAEVHDLKTGRLMLACMNMTLAAADPSAETVLALRQFATHLGLAFQMQDDYLDSYDTQSLGKGRASDQANLKTTFATYYTEATLRKAIQTHFKNTEQALSVFSERAIPLNNFLHALLERSHHLILHEQK
ncbi:MAG: polyprenyl synthetase family protein [Legionellaceae bacterium]|nr:polyprenyl synthetase family protein [Legionellaceae bacterium]